MFNLFSTLRLKCAEKAVSTEPCVGEVDHYVCVGVLQSQEALIISKYIICNVRALQPSSINYMPLCAAKLVFLEGWAGL